MYPWPDVEKWFQTSDFRRMLTILEPTVGCVLIEIGSDGFLACWLLPVMGPPGKDVAVGSAAPYIILSLLGYSSLHSPPDYLYLLVKSGDLSKGF